jgi:hypothetical protein
MWSPTEYGVSLTSPVKAMMSKVLSIKLGKL